MKALHYPYVPASGALQGFCGVTMSTVTRRYLPKSDHFRVDATGARDPRGGTCAT
jgi:hypothetical protein